MKIITFAFAFMPFLGMAQIEKGNPFSITGKVADDKRGIDHIIYLKFKQNNKEITDSAKLLDGTYSFKGLIAYPTKAVLQLKVPDSVSQYHQQTRILKDYAHEFYIDKGEMLAVSSEKLNKTIVRGSAADTERQQLKALLDPYYKSSSKLYQDEGKGAYERKDSLAIARYSKKSNAIQNSIDSIKKAFLFNHPQSGMAIDMLQEYTRTILEPAEIVPLFEKVQGVLKTSAEGIAYANRIRMAKNTAIGVKAPDFELKDRQGKPVTLASLKGKLVLLDFWGSWCYPCRQTHPHLRKLYAAHKAKGFEILGVANERGTAAENYKKWTAALDQDQMTWTNVLAEAPENDKPSVPKQYSVNAYPTKILIDRAGFIVKKFVGSGETNAKELDQLIEKLLQN